MTEDDVHALVDEIEDELVDYAVPVWSVPGWVRRASRHLDDPAVIELSARICDILLSRDHLELVWIEGHYDRPFPDGPRTLSRVAPATVTTAMFECPEDLLTRDPYLAIDRVS